MAKTNLKLYSTNGLGEDITTTINYVNPEASKSDILEFTQALNGLTRNVYKETEKVTTVNVDLEPVPATPTLTASITQYSAASFTQYSEDGTMVGAPTVLTYSGNGLLVIDSQTMLATNLRYRVTINENKVAVRPFYVIGQTPTFPITFKVGFTATDNYQACSLDITVTA